MNLNNKIIIHHIQSQLFPSNNKMLITHLISFIITKNNCPLILEASVIYKFTVYRKINQLQNINRALNKPIYKNLNTDRMSVTLTKNGIPSLLQQQNSSLSSKQHVLVQIIGLKTSKNGKHIPCHISDGYRKVKAVINCQTQKIAQCKYLNNKKENMNLSLVRVKSYQTIRNGDVIRGVELLQFDIEGLYSEVIGDPVNYSEFAELSESATNYFDPDKFRTKRKQQQQSQQHQSSFISTTTTSNKPIQIIEQQKTKKPSITINLQDSTQDITQKRLIGSDRISDLYVDMGAFQIVCRITGMTYKEFMSKKSNKFTQILNIELMDRTGMKIEGTVFGEYAKELEGRLVMNGLYKISGGHIRQESYKTNKGPKYSRHTINFTANSQFTALHDTTLIPQFDQNAAYQSVQQVIQQKDFDKQYDLVGILTEIGQQKQLTDKNGKPLTKRVISISDPQNNHTMEITLWRDVKFDQSLKGRTVLLKNFKLSSYKNNLTMNSLFKSQIKPLQQHRYRKYQNNINIDQFKHVTLNENQQEYHSDDCRTIKRLQTQIEYIEQDQTIYSTLNAYVSLISFKGKWFYESCPKCKKGGAQSNSTCHNCRAFIDEPISRFILPIEIADCTGSIWTTAFDEFASVILKGKDIQTLKKFDQVRLREQGQKRIFQQFRFRVATKKQYNGAIKHTICGKPYEMNIQRVIMENIDRIYQYE